VKPTKVYKSKESNLPHSDVPGGFPASKGPVNLALEDRQRPAVS
jgi:hypothetical protein